MERQRIYDVQKKLAINIAVACYRLPITLAWKIATKMLLQTDQKLASIRPFNQIPHKPRHGAPSSTRPTLPTSEDWNNWLWEVE